MPTFPQQSPWQQDAAAISGLGQQLNQLMVGLAQQKFQQQQQQQMMGMRLMELKQQAALDRQRGQLYDSQTAAVRADELLTNAKLKDQERLSGLGRDFGRTFDYISQAQANPNMPLDVNRLMSTGVGQAAELAAAGRQHVPENFAQLSVMNDPRLRALVATGGTPIQHAPSESVIMDVLSGMPSYTSPQKLSAGQVMVPGTGGPAMASAPFAPRNALTPYASLLGSSQNLAQQYRDSSGEVNNPDDPNFQANEAVMALILQQLKEELQKPQNVSREQTLQGQPAQIDSGASGIPAVGEVRKGYRFLGGNPADRNSWEKVQ